MRRDIILGFASCAFGLLPLLHIEKVYAQQPSPQSITSNLVVGGNGTSASFAATLLSVSGKTLFLCGADVNMGDSAASTALIQITNGSGGLGGIQTSVLNYLISPVAGNSTFSLRWNPCLPAAGSNAAIQIVAGTDNNRTTASAFLFGFLY